MMAAVFWLAAAPGVATACASRRDWLAAASFERTHEIVSAINTLSVHAKLLLSGINDPDDVAVKQARARLTEFLERVEALLRDAEQNGEGTVVGADPRLGDLALRFLSSKQRLPRQSAIFSTPFDRLRELIASEQADDLQALIPCLHDLRSLVEQHSRADVASILGDN